MNPVKKSWLQGNFAEAIGNRRNITQHYTGGGYSNCDNTHFVLRCPAIIKLNTGYVGFVINWLPVRQHRNMLSFFACFFICNMKMVFPKRRRSDTGGEDAL